MLREDAQRDGGIMNTYIIKFYPLPKDRYTYDKETVILAQTLEIALGKFQFLSEGSVEIVSIRLDKQDVIL